MLFRSPKGDIVKISFRLQIEENIIDSELMQVLPIQFAKELISGLLMQEQAIVEAIPVSEPVIPQAVETPIVAPQVQQASMPQVMPTEMPKQAPMMDNLHMANDPNYFGENYRKPVENIKADVDIQTPQFEAFDNRSKAYPKENMDLLMDVSLEVSVELGRTSRKIKEILEFGPGSIIELNRLDRKSVV